MDFVNNINLITPIAGGKFNIFPESTDLIDTAVGSPINFNDIKTITVGNFQAGRACKFLAVAI